VRVDCPRPGLWHAEESHAQQDSHRSRKHERDFITAVDGRV
jgi:hypothetical protein